jgi:hypothetical protein
MHIPVLVQEIFLSLVNILEEYHRSEKTTG